MNQKYRHINLHKSTISVIVVFFISFSLATHSAFGQYIIPATPTSNFYFQDFNSLPTSGSVPWNDPPAATLPFWYMQRTPVTPGTPPYPITLVADDGSTLTGNAYSYGTTGTPDRALGSVGSNNALSGHYAWGMLFQNTSGAVVSDFKVAYRGEQWRDGGFSPTAPQKVTFAYKKGVSAITNLQPSVTASWTTVAALYFNAPVNSGTATALNGNMAPNLVQIASQIAGLSLNNNEYLMMKWDDPKYGGNNDQGMATDSIYISWVVCVTPTAATNIFASANGDTDIDLEWTNGSGSGRYVVINTVNSFTNPVDGTAIPAFNPVYTGSGEQVVYAGPANSVTVSGLLPCTEYYFRVFEYNCSGVNSKVLYSSSCQ